MARNSVINTGALGASYIITDGAGALSATGGVLITKYTANNTWTKNARTKMVLVYSWNGGGGGGSGKQGVTAASGGGGGGSCGATLLFSAPATWFNSSESVTIGSGGTGGTGQAAVADGNPGTNGGVSSIGNVYASLVTNNFGAGGINGAAAGGTAQLAYQGNFAYYGIAMRAGTAGANSTAGNVSDQGVSSSGLEDASSTALTILWPGSGAGGAGANTVSPRTGGLGGNTVSFSRTTSGAVLVAGGAGGVETGTIDGGNGNPFISTTGGRLAAASGGGGGGGQSTGLVAGNGGDGGIPGGGGGGGGGSITLTTSGGGGDGGRGEVWVIEFL